ncbi:MAG: 3-hydroxyacyl-ACP dehydratase FabZ [Oligoflexia bacterium]|nr:3-hydroxyacyl-ACP dehydratase FabZ [Oligoflexia bacterium]
MRFFLIDKIIEIEVGIRARAIKNVSMSEDFFDDHFPSHPTMPGVLIIEGMAQLSGYLLYHSLKKISPEQNRKAVMIAINKAKFREIVRPGHQIIYASTICSLDEVSAKVKVCASVEDRIVAEAELSFVMAENNSPILEKSLQEIFAFWSEDLK